MTLKLSIVVPCFNEEESIPIFVSRVADFAAKICDSYELIFVDDGSTDCTLQVLRKLAKGDARVRYISFSRNFGKEAALFAGLEAASSDLVCVMDADLQDPPNLLPIMAEAIINGGYDIAAARRVSRKGEPIIRSFFAKLFYWLVNLISDVRIVEGARDFRLMKRQVVDAILSLKEYGRFSKGLFQWVGFQTKWIEYENVERVAGRSKWNFWQLFLYSLDGIVAFSVKPLAIASILGVLLCLGAFIGILAILIHTLIIGIPTNGWASTVSIILFAVGLQLFCTGILGQYLSKIYLEIKRRPIYIVKETSS